MHSHSGARMPHRVAQQTTDWLIQDSCNNRKLSVINDTHAVCSSYLRPVNYKYHLLSIGNCAATAATAGHFTAATATAAYHAVVATITCRVPTITFHAIPFGGVLLRSCKYCMPITIFFMVVLWLGGGGGIHFCGNYNTFTLLRFF